MIACQATEFGVGLLRMTSQVFVILRERSDRRISGYQSAEGDSSSANDCLPNNRVWGRPPQNDKLCPFSLNSRPWDRNDNRILTTLSIEDNTHIGQIISGTKDYEATMAAISSSFSRAVM
jgi:hypothetical protein